MKKVFYLFLLFISVVISACSSTKEESKVIPFEAKGDLPNFGLRGPVKSVTFTSLSWDKNNFSTDGRLSSEDQFSVAIERDEDGTITGINIPGSNISNITYYSDGHVKSYSQWIRYEGDITHTLSYDNNGYLQKKVSLNEENGDSTVVTFSYPEIDEHGNWVKRVSENDSLSREIEYYSEDETSEVSDNEPELEDMDKKICDFIEVMYNERKYEDYDFLKKHCNNQLLRKLEKDYQDEFEDGSSGTAYATWDFRTLAQDGKSEDDCEYKIISVRANGDGWYTYEFLDMGFRGINTIKAEVVDGEVIMYDLLKEYDELDQ